jgi:hypothetical protein
MKRSDGNRVKLGALVMAVALVAAAMLALPGLSIGKGPHSGEPAGTVESYDSATGQLVIDLAKGDSISALVTDRTHVRCGDKGRRRHGHPPSHDSGNSASASQSGRSANAGPPPEGKGRGPSGDRPRGPRDESSGEGPPEGDDTPGEGREERCRALLVPGTPVKGAVIVLIDGDAFYKDVGLVAPKAPEPSSS